MPDRIQKLREGLFGGEQFLPSHIVDEEFQF